jgi:GNAT superfamily N-acetyltransferase
MTARPGRRSARPPLSGRIRPATTDDLPLLRDLERAAGVAFADLGMGAVADDEPPPIEALREYQSDGRAWVWADGQDRPLAYLITALVDGNAHLEQVSVHPAFARRRIGQALLARLEDWAVTRRLPAITLTTYTQVPWNGPYYERLGFRYLMVEELSPGLHRIREAEAAHGLDRWPRSAMRRDIAAGQAAGQAAGRPPITLRGRSG